MVILSFCPVSVGDTSRCGRFILVYFFRFFSPFLYSFHMQIGARACWQDAPWQVNYYSFMHFSWVQKFTRARPMSPADVEAKPTNYIVILRLYIYYTDDKVKPNYYFPILHSSGSSCDIHLCIYSKFKNHTQFYELTKIELLDN